MMDIPIDLGGGAWAVLATVLLGMMWSTARKVPAFLVAWTEFLRDATASAREVRAFVRATTATAELGHQALTAHLRAKGVDPQKWSPHDSDEMAVLRDIAEAREGQARERLADRAPEDSLHGHLARDAGTVLKILSDVKRLPNDLRSELLDLLAKTTPTDVPQKRKWWRSSGKVKAAQ